MTVSQGSLKIQRLCRLAGVSRAGYYRFWQKSAPRAHDTAVRSAIQEVALAHGRRRGYRYITHELRRERGMVVNHKRVRRLMGEDNLLCLRRKAFVPQTTDSRHDWEIVPNLAKGLRLSGLDQLWVADITYIRLQEEFAYLAVILDAFSRAVIGWAMADHLRASLAIDALVMALEERCPAWGSLIHHSDRGVCLWRLYQVAQGARHCRQHEPGRQSLRQRQGRELHEDAQDRRGRRQALSQSQGGRALHRHLHRRSLQQATPAFGPGLSPTARV